MQFSLKEELGQSVQGVQEFRRFQGTAAVQGERWWKVFVRGREERRREGGQ